MRDTKLVASRQLGEGHREAVEAFWKRSMLTGSGSDAHDIVTGIWNSVNGKMMTALCWC